MNGSKTIILKKQGIQNLNRGSKTTAVNAGLNKLRTHCMETNTRRLVTLD